MSPARATHAAADEAIARYVARRRWLHGTRREAHGAAAAASGHIAPSSETGLGRFRGEQRPMPGRVYLTDLPAFALDYAAGSWLGLADSSTLASWVHRLRLEVASGDEDRYGYVFRVSGGAVARAAALEPRGVEPDEDAVGYAYYRAYQRLMDEGDGPLDPDLMDYRWPGLLRAIEADAGLASRVNDAAAAMTLQQQARAEGGDLKAWASGGKRMVRAMAPGLRAELVEAGASISVAGRLPIEAAWRLDKYRVAELARGAADLLSICEPVRVGA